MAQTQQGVTYRYNGKKPRTPLGKVTISYDNNKRSVLSDANSGKFSLTLEGLKMGDRIGLVTVKKREMMVFNQHAVDEWSLRKEPLCLILCNADEFERQKANLIEIGKREAKKKYDQQKAELEAKLNASQMKQQEYEDALDKAYDELNRFQKNVGEYADLFARIDESEVDTLAQRALDLFNQGHVDEAIRLFEQGHYMEKLDKALKNSQQADLLKTVAEKAKELATQDSLKALQSLKAQIEAYKMNNEWDKAGELLKGLADRLNTVDDCFAYAGFCRNQNNFIDAEAYYKRAISLLDKQREQETQVHLYYKSCLLNNLANLYSDTQRFSESEEIYKEALEISHRLAQTNPQAYDSDVARTLNNLAILYMDTQRFTQSEEVYKEALDIRRRLAKTNPQAYEPDVAQTLNNLAILHNNTQRFTEGEEMYKEALDIYRRLAKENQQAYEPDLAQTLNNLAVLYTDTQRFTEGEGLFKEALEIRRRLAKNNPQAYEPDLAQTLNNLAVIYKNVQRFTESETMYKEALEIRRRLAKENPQAYEPDVATTLYNLANLYSDTQRFTESETMYKEALEIRRRLAKDNQQAYEPYLAQTQYNIGLLKVNIEQYEDAIPPLEEALSIYRKISQTNPAKRPYYESSLYLLGTLYNITKNYLAAYHLYQEWRPIMKQRYEADPASTQSDYATQLGHQSFYCIFAKQFAEAEQYAREGLAIDPTKHFIYTNLAAALLFQGKYQEAEQIYRQYKDELKDGFLDDFKQFAETGVIPQEREADVERIKRLIEE
jgi:tetratricopeptide (TPR) repeat protein